MCGQLSLTRWQFCALSRCGRAGILAPQLTEAAVLGQPYWAAPGLVAVLILGPRFAAILLVVLGSLAGMSLWAWRSQQADALTVLDLQRQRQYELESLQRELLTANVQVARMSELSERSRIAREIHGRRVMKCAAYMSPKSCGLYTTTRPLRKSSW